MLEGRSKSTWDGRDSWKESGVQQAAQGGERAPGRASELVPVGFGRWVWGPRVESSGSLWGRELLLGGPGGGPYPRGQVCMSTPHHHHHPPPSNSPNLISPTKLVELSPWGFLHGRALPGSPSAQHPHHLRPRLLSVCPVPCASVCP